MDALNTSKGPLRVESGEIAPGDCGELTDKEFKFLSDMGRAEVAAPPIPSAPAAPKPKKKPAKKPAAPDEPEGFL